MIRRLTPSWRLRATMASLVFPPMVHFLSLPRISRWIERSSSPRSSDGSVDDSALAEWVDRVLKRLPPPWRHTCLKRALVLHYLLHRAGRPVGLRIGVRRDEHQAIAAHAWLVREESPYLELGAEPIDSYQVIAAFPAAPEVPR